MSDRFNCAVHGLQLVDNYNDGCQWCRWAEEDAARDRDEMKKSLSEIARTMTNLGDYACPYCMQTSLKTGASRCPLCRGEIGGDYWNAVRARQKADAERQVAAAQAAAERQRVYDERQKALAEAAAAEWKRTAPEREAAAARAAAEAKQLRRNAASRKNRDTGTGIGAIIGGIVMGFSGCVSCVNHHASHAGDFSLTPFNLFTGLLMGAIAGAVIGALVGYASGQSKE
jgi:uncharacterized protein YcfJ